MLHPQAISSPPCVKRNNKDVKKIKGVSMRLKTNIDLEAYKSCLDKSQPIYGIYTHKDDLVKYEQTKKAINGCVLDKMIVLSNYFPAPYLSNLTTEDYLVIVKLLFFGILTSL
jgi:hypothetical protein